jgi:hypothetical protein
LSATSSERQWIAAHTPAVVTPFSRSADDAPMRPLCGVSPAAISAPSASVVTAVNSLR